MSRPKMIEIKMGEPIYIGSEVQRMPRVDCEYCGKTFWTLPCFDQGLCPGCQVELGFNR
jgi:hypothetical protein